MKVLAEVPNLIILPPPNPSFIKLKESNGTRMVNIRLNYVSIYHALVILEKTQTPKPIIHQLMINTLQMIGADLEKVVVTDFVNTMYHSIVYIRLGNQTHIIDAHVTDAIILAFIKECPIFVDEEVFKKTNDYIAKMETQISDEKALKTLEDMDNDKLIKH